MKTYANDMIPGDVFHPSLIVKDELEARGIKQIELARITGFNKSFISLFLKGERDIILNLQLHWKHCFR
jgi:plasmid maintenance system antidote protein VapI